MNSPSLSLSADCVCISGEHYTISNGYASKANGNVRLPFDSILAVEYVKRRSKKMLYVMLLIMGIALTIISIISNMYDSTELFVIIFVAFSVPATIVGIAYFFSGRRYVELTTMQGTYRVAITHESTEIERVVEQLQKRRI